MMSGDVKICYWLAQDFKLEISKIREEKYYLKIC